MLLETAASASTGASTAHRFTGSIGGNFYDPAWMGDVFQLEHMHNHNSYQFGMGMNHDAPGETNFYPEAGYGRVYRFKSFVIKPALGNGV